MLLVLSLSLLLAGGTLALSTSTCTDNSQCAQSECCQILSEFMIVSRRELKDLLAPRPDKLVKSGTCEPYRNEGDNCNSFAKANGYCSCAPGLHCKGEEVYQGTPPPTKLPLTFPPVRKRSMIPPRPGYTWEFKCRQI